MLEMKNLIVNIGSASKKYAIYDGENQLIDLYFEIYSGNYALIIKIDGYQEKHIIKKGDYDFPLEYLMDVLIKKSILKSIKEIGKIGIRIVAPGLFFTENKLIDAKYLNNLKIAYKKAPLHVELVLTELGKLNKIFKNIPTYGISDSAFHKDMPQKAKLYGLPISFSKTHEIYRYGYHGISLESIVDKLNNRGGFTDKIIVCHLGGGVTVCAIKDGICIDTSMGFTPLEGMVMATRVGDIDPGALIYLSEITGFKGHKLLDFLNHECGLLGLSNKTSSSIKELLEVENQNEFAMLALDIYAYKIQKQIGAYIASLGGVDKIVFTGTVGERSFKMRERILSQFSYLGVVLDKEINDRTENNDIIISAPDSKVKIEVLRTEELKQITKNLLNIK